MSETNPISESPEILKSPPFLSASSGPGRVQLSRRTDPRPASLLPMRWPKSRPSVSNRDESFHLTEVTSVSRLIGAGPRDQAHCSGNIH
jgi:hypothetical protein